MRFHRKNGIPDNPDFEPQTDARWQPLPEPAAETLQVYALIPLALTVPPLVLCWWWVLVRSGEAVDLVALLAEGLLAVVPLIIVHEAIHLLHPGHGRHDHSIVGGSSKHGVIYALYFGEMSRARYVAILLGPFVVLTVLPWLYCLATGRFIGIACSVSIWNALFACGDLLGAWLIVRGSPPGAILRNRGYYTWWRLPG